MKRKMLIGFICAALFVVATAGTAAADDGGLRHINWPAHDCAGATPTHVDLYMHTWLYLPARSFREDGRIRYFSGTCAKAAILIHVYKIILWQYFGGWRNVADSGAHDINVLFGDATWSTPDIACLPPVLKTHVEVQYRIYWKDGTTTATRDDNSLDWWPTPCPPIGKRIR